VPTVFDKTTSAHTTTTTTGGAAIPSDSTSPLAPQADDADDDTTASAGKPVSDSATFTGDTSESGSILKVSELEAH